MKKSSQFMNKQLQEQIVAELPLRRNLGPLVYLRLHLESEIYNHLKSNPDEAYLKEFSAEKSLGRIYRILEETEVIVGGSDKFVAAMELLSANAANLTPAQVDIVHAVTTRLETAPIFHSTAEKVYELVEEVISPIDFAKFEAEYGISSIDLDNPLPVDLLGVGSYHLMPDIENKRIDLNNYIYFSNDSKSQRYRVDILSLHTMLSLKDPAYKSNPIYAETCRRTDSAMGYYTTKCAAFKDTPPTVADIFKFGESLASDLFDRHFFAKYFTALQDIGYDLWVCNNFASVQNATTLEKTKFLSETDLVSSRSSDKAKSLYNILLAGDQLSVDDKKWVASKFGNVKHRYSVKEWGSIYFISLDSPTAPVKGGPPPKRGGATPSKRDVVKEILEINAKAFNPRSPNSNPLKIEVEARDPQSGTINAIFKAYSYEELKGALAEYMVQAPPAPPTPPAPPPVPQVPPAPPPVPQTPPAPPPVPQAVDTGTVAPIKQVAPYTMLPPPSETKENVAHNKGVAQSLLDSITNLTDTVKQDELIALRMQQNTRVKNQGYTKTLAIPVRILGKIITDGLVAENQRDSLEFIREFFSINDQLEINFVRPKKSK